MRPENVMPIATVVAGAKAQVEAFRDFHKPFVPRGDQPATNLTIREVFAAKAMEGYCSDPSLDWMSASWAKKVAEASVLVADALIAKLGERKPDEKPVDVPPDSGSGGGNP